MLAGAINSGNHKLLTQALQCFLIIPQFALIKAARDTVSSQDIARQLLEFGEGRLKKQSEEKSRASVDNGQEDSDKALVKALNQVKHFGNEGRYAKASRGLAQAVSGRRGALEPTEEVVAQLKQLHPPASHTPNKPPDISPKHLPIDNNKLKKAANKIANGSAADVFGWRRAHSPAGARHPHAPTWPSWSAPFGTARFPKKPGSGCLRAGSSHSTKGRAKSGPSQEAPFW